MRTAGGVIALIAGIFGIIAAVVTLFMGGVGGAFEADGADIIIGLGWGGIVFTFLVIIFSAVALGTSGKTAPILLILSSILGAILGGTLVAIFMALAFIGGLLTLFGKNNTRDKISEVAQDNVETYNKNRNIGKIILIVLAVPIILIIVIGILSPSTKGPTPSKADKLAEQLESIANSSASEIDPVSLGSFYNLMSDTTDLQREKKEKEITGKIIEWTLPVYEVSMGKNNEYYKIQTSSTEYEVGTFIDLYPRNDKEQAFIEALKTGDLITVKGKIAGVSLTRNIELKPAILLSEITSPAVVESSPNTDATQETGEELMIVRAELDVDDLWNKVPTDIDKRDLANIFNLMSDYTDLQREKKEKEITGKIIEWTLPVYEVSMGKNNEYYKIQTSSTEYEVGTFIDLYPRNDKEQAFIEALKTGDLITVKGRIAGTFMRNINLQPAILITDTNEQVDSYKSINENEERIKHVNDNEYGYLIARSKQPSYTLEVFAPEGKNNWCKEEVLLYLYFDTKELPPDDYEINTIIQKIGLGILPVECPNVIGIHAQAFIYDTGSMYLSSKSFKADQWASMEIIQKDQNINHGQKTRFDKYDADKPEYEMSCFDSGQGIIKKYQKVKNKIIIYSDGVKTIESEIVEEDKNNIRFIIVNTLFFEQEQMIDFKNRKIHYSDDFGGGIIECI
jgi:hypothetical protein